MNIAIDIACNDPDNGLFDGRIAGIELAHRCLSLQPRVWKREPRMRVTDTHLVVSNKKFPIIDWQEWLGNWCWNRYWVTLDTAADFFTWLHAKNTFSVDMGDTELFHLWKADGPFARDDFRALIEREEVQS